MSAVLTIEGVTRRFGDVVAVNDVSFCVQRGEVCGFVGPNGAGKTTTMRIAATLDLPDAGEVHVDGLSIHDAPREVRAKLGFMPDGFGVYTSTTVREYLDFFARAYDLRNPRRTQAVAQAAEFTSLTGHFDVLVTALSKGMRQRLCLAKTLLHDPDVLILDEPAAGLDPRARIELRELVIALAARGKAVLVSSHILSELAEMATTLAIIEQGRLKAHGSFDAIRGRLGRGFQVRVRALAPHPTVHRVLLEAPGVESVRDDGASFDVTITGGEEGAAALLAHLVAADTKPVAFAPIAADLEDLFLQLTEGNVS